MMLIAISEVATATSAAAQDKAPCDRCNKPPKDAGWIRAARCVTTSPADLPLCSEVKSFSAWP